jgi:DNA-binding response OmpR family regulator
MRLLIVEDDDKTARALESGLQSEGFWVVLAHTGEEGFFLLSSESFDLIVLDWMLPGRTTRCYVIIIDQNKAMGRPLAPHFETAYSMALQCRLNARV